MLALTRSTRILCGLTPLLLFGCFSPPYQSGYGSPYGTSPYVSPPGGYTVPPGSYQKSTPPPSDGNLGTPGKVGGANNGTSSTGPTPAIGTGQSTGGNLVPDYNDPNKADGSSKNTTDSGDFPANGESGKTGDGVMNMNDADKGGSPFSSQGAFNQDSSKTQVKLTGGEQQQPPAGFTSGAPEPKRFQPPMNAGQVPDATQSPDANKAPAINDTKTPGTPSPYDYDRKKYTWLRGRLDFDDTSKSWQLMYSLNGGDQYGGVLTLSDDPRLKKLRSGDVVLVEGTVDATKKDGRNKPRYKINDLFGPLVPKSQLGESQETPAKGGNSQASNLAPGEFPR